MEEDIDKEIELEKVAKEHNESPPEPVKQKVNCDFKSLDEMVSRLGQRRFANLNMLWRYLLFFFFSYSCTNLSE